MKKLLVVLMLVLTSCNSNLAGLLEEPTPESVPTAIPVVVEEVIEVEEPVILSAGIGVWASNSIFYFNGCAPLHKNTFTAQVTNLEVYDVTLHVRFVDLEGEGTTEWNTYAMNQYTNGDWSRTLVGNDLKSMSEGYEFMLLEYQAIAWSVPNVAALRTEVQWVTFEVCQE